MNNKDERKVEINSFLEQIEEKLPGWLKDDKKELESVKQELEEHIWDKSDDIAQGQEPNIIHVRTAIAQMGTPRSIAREYKKRGTPKIYITEELFPWYLKGLKIVIGIIFILNIVGFVIDVSDGSISPESIFGTIGGLITASIYSAFFITLIFVGLSMEGFLPDDFKEMAEEEHKKETGGKIKPPINIKELLGDGISSIIFGILFILMPFESINAFLGEQMVFWCQMSGVFTLIQGTLKLLQSLMGIQSITTQQILMISVAFVDVFAIRLWLAWDEAILSIPAVTDWGLHGMLSLVLPWISYLIVFGVVVALIEAVVNAFRYRTKLDAYQATRL